MLMEGLVDGPLKGPQVIDIITTAIVIDRESFKLVDPTATGKGLGLIQERKVI